MISRMAPSLSPVAGRVHPLPTEALSVGNFRTIFRANQDPGGYICPTKSLCVPPARVVASSTSQTIVPAHPRQVIVQGFFKNPVVAFFASLKLSAALLASVAVASGYATFFENVHGRDGAYDAIYAARWFEVLLILMTANMTLLFVKRWPYEMKQSGYVLVHLSIIVILFGAGMTRYLGYEGIMPIREGQSTDFIYSDRLHVQLTQDESLASFPVRLWKTGENSIRHKVTLDGRKFELGVSEYWPHCEETWQEGPGGVPAIQYGVREGADFVDRTLREGATDHIAGVEARYLRRPFEGEMATARLGEVRLRVGSESCSFAVQWPDPTVHECNGWRFEIAGFQTDFKVGAASSATGSMRNPMVNLTITSPTGETGERRLFAFHPDFSMGHSGGGTDFEDLNLLYQVSSGFEMSAGGATGVQARASFDLVGMTMEAQEQVEIPAGTIFDLVPETLYRGVDNDFSLVPVNMWQSAVKAPGLSSDAKAPAAARLFVRDSEGNEADVVCFKHRGAQTVLLGDQTFGLAWASVVKKLPYRVHLDDFVLQTYPGSDNPATYESYVSLYDPEQGIDGRKAHIFMNSPMNHRGTKHFQSSYDPDRRGTVLSVNHDPGKWPTYFGYSLISLGFILILLKDLLWPRRRHEGHAAEPVSLVVALMALGLMALAVPAAAQTDDHAGHNHPPGEHGTTATSGYVALSEPAREAASRLIIQDYRGRMKPLDTMAREMVMKVYKRTKLKDGEQTRQPVDVYLSWSLNPSFWMDKPVIGVRYPGVKDVLGVSHDTRHVSLSSLVDERGQYRLTEVVREAHRTPDRERTKTQRKLISFDERANLLNMVFSGAGLRLYPVPGDDNNTWHSLDEMRSDLTAEQSAIFGNALGALTQGIRTGDNAQIMAGITRTADLQRQYGAAVIPSQLSINAELSYNRGHLFSWSMIPFLVAFMVLMTVYVVNLFRNAGRRLSFRNPFYSFGVLCYTVAFGMGLYAYVLRWVASGRAPLSNGHESLLFIALAVALAGLIFELGYRMAVPAGLGGLLTVVVLGVSMLSTFDPAIGPLVPVLVSYWLNIHVTIITSSYGFLGLSSLIGMLILILYVTKAPGRTNVKDAIKTLDGINYNVMVAGLGLLTIGTLLGGVWANESWGRYWGWDAKETWSLVTILVYSAVLHFRFIPRMKSAWFTASLATGAISSVVMTYFGVNYFLSGLHSYASGDAATVPDWVYVFVLVVLALVVTSGLVHANRKWEAEG